MQANPAIASLPRRYQRKLLSDEDRARKSGDWGPWERVTFPRGSAGRTWAAEFTVAHRNRVFSVLDRDVEGGYRHLAVASLSGVRPTWWEMQRIKDEIAGKDATAVEVYPPHDQIVDGADMFHIWVMAYPLRFGLHASQQPAHTAGDH